MAIDAAHTPWSEDDTRVLQILASVLTSQRHEDRAVVLLEYARDKAPENVELKKALSGVYLLLRRHGEALTMADQVIDEMPGDAAIADLMLVRSKALWGLGREPEAQAAMRDYMAIRQRP